MEIAEGLRIGIADLGRAGCQPAVRGSLPRTDFGILTIAGGILGYVKAGSMASIIAGSISGVLLLLAAWLMPEHQAAGLIIALIVSLLLAGQFIPKFFRTFKVMPAGLMSVLSAIGIIVAIAAWLRK